MRRFLSTVSQLIQWKISGKGIIGTGRRHQFRYYCSMRVTLSVVTVLAAAGLALLNLETDKTFEMTFQTVIGEKRDVPMPDGSTIQLNTGTELNVKYDGKSRRIRMYSGEARFAVAKDESRPFIVETTQATIRAIGTSFNVRIDAERTSVAVFQGVVEVIDRKALPSGLIAKPNRLYLKSGERAATAGTGIEQNAGPDYEHARSWPTGLLNFRDETLRNVIAESNRYHSDKIVIEDAELAEQRISGTLDITDRNSLLDTLRFHYGAELVIERDGPVLRRGSGANQKNTDRLWP